MSVNPVKPFLALLFCKPTGQLEIFVFEHKRRCTSSSMISCCQSFPFLLFASRQEVIVLSLCQPWSLGWQWEDGGCSWNELHFSAGISVHSHFMHNIFGMRLLWKCLCFCYRSTESVASVRSSTAVNSHKLISPPEIQISSCTLTLTLVTLWELTSE